MIKVLLVEDNPVQASLISSILSNQKNLFEVSQANSLTRAFAAVGQDKIDAILLDLGLPESQGFETFEKMYLSATHIPIVILTGLEDETVALEAVQKGAQDYLVKGQIDHRMLPRVIRYSIERKRLEDSLRQAQKMDAVGRLAGGVAHDFNNLLTVIRGYADLRLKAMPQNDPVRPDLEEIQKAAVQASGITGQLLAFSRRQMVRPEVVSLNEILTSSYKMMQRLLGDRCELTLSLADSIWNVKVDPVQIKQVLFNLVSNARDAMPKGGVLKFETENIKLNENQYNSKLKPGDYVMVSAIDNGTGMTPEVKNCLFEPFFTTKDKSKGSGLGLATSYGIIKQARGDIIVESELGKGSVFRVLLPKTSEPVSELPKTEEGKSLPKGDETILLVEDEPAVRDLVVRILKAQGYKVLQANSGVEALRISREEIKTQVDLLLTDILMPLMDGKELESKLKLARPKLKSLFMSGFTDNAIDEQGILKSGIFFIQKPFTPTSLVIKVREVLDEKR